MNKQSKTSYDLNEAIQYILEPGSESELSDLELSSDEEDDNNLFVVTRINDEISICEEEQCMTADILLEDEINIEFTTPDKPNTNEQTSSSTSPKPITHNYKWCNKSPPIRDTTFSGCEFSLPSSNVDTFTPLIFFTPLISKCFGKILSLPYLPNKQIFTVFKYLLNLLM